MVALAFLAICTANAAPPAPADPYHHARSQRLDHVKAAEIRRLFNALVIAPLRALTLTPVRAVRHGRHWSHW